MKYLLDTCVVSDFVRGVGPVQARLRSTAPPLVAISVVTVLEVRFGLLLRPAVARRLSKVVDGLFGAATVLPFETEDAERAASLRADLRRKGLPIGAYDLLIGATALRRDLVLVTSNTAEFEHCEGLVLEDWRAGA
jgi:tRNA(fMet)-specific endonuclease VapC